ncbi:hypothetical protein, partial [Geosporobacter ferrireducens]|uniref:hypothetical protein n=1 Tax=Geosporobacter ferrireducens TaxID=1424294 RepID=UPI0023579B4D
SIVNGVGSLVAYKPDDSILGENKTTVNNGPTWVDRLKDAALYIKDKAIDTSKLIPATIILTGYYLNEYKESVTLLKGTRHLDISDDALKWLNKGDADNIVYHGIKNGEEVYTGITKQELAKRLYQHNYSGKNLDDLVEQISGLTRNQARAVEQYLIENSTANALNKINSISPSHKYYDEAMRWAEEFINSLD